MAVTGNPGLAELAPYPFERLRALLADLEPPADLPPVRLSIGEPQHPVPQLITEALKDGAGDSLGRYPASAGSVELRETITNWIRQRYGLADQAMSAERHVLPVAGTREALFAATQALLDRDRKPLVMMPNPFYQIYEGAAWLAGGAPVYLNTWADGQGLPDLDAITESTWARCGLIYLCSPGNPGGQVIPLDFWKRLFDLRDRHGFVIAADECYSELYRDENQPPLGLLEACQRAGRDDFNGCLVFHSLSKRSNAPGLRAGFVAGDSQLISRFASYRTYQGCALPLHTQAAAMVAWRDEAHVLANRDAYREKFQLASSRLQGVAPYAEPAAGFYVWLPVPEGDDENFARRLYAAQGVTVLPGRYLSRPTEQGDPGAGHVRLALVAPSGICEDALNRIRNFLIHQY